MYNFDGLYRYKAEYRASVHLPNGVIVDDAYPRDLGVESVGDEVELFGDRAIVRGVSQGVRTFTASPFVFASLKSARQYDKRYRSDEVSYVLVRCCPGHSVAEVKQSIATSVPHVEVLTTREFAVRTVSYWMLETGLGITVVITACLGFLVAAVVTSQTLYTVTQDHIRHYGTLAAHCATGTEDKANESTAGSIAPFLAVVTRPVRCSADAPKGRTSSRLAPTIPLPAEPRPAPAAARCIPAPRRKACAPFSARDAWR